MEKSIKYLTKKNNMRVRNPSNIQMKNGQLTDKYGRTFSIDWEEFEKVRKKKETTVINSTKLNK
jgi:hypothetical protein